MGYLILALRRHGYSQKSGVTKEKAIVLLKKLTRDSLKSNQKALDLTKAMVNFYNMEKEK